MDNITIQVLEGTAVTKLMHVGQLHIVLLHFPVAYPY